MTSWKLLYDNGFPRNPESGGTVLTFHRAAAGTLSIQSGPVFTIFTGFHGFGIGNGRNMTYRPTAPPSNVIGVDASMEIALIRLLQSQPVTLFSTTDFGLSATLMTTAPPTPGVQNTYRLTIRVADAIATVNGLGFRQFFSPQLPLERRRLQVRWTNNGQLHVFLDGALVAYENAVKPGHQFNLTQMAIGNVDLPLTAVVNAAVSNFRLIELREDAAADSLGQQLEPEKVPDLSPECRKVAVGGLTTVLREARALMAAFNASKTSPWRTGQSGSPFTPSAVAVHTVGTQAAEAFNRYLRNATPESRKEVATNLTKLLEILAENQPALFKALVAKTKAARDALDGHCSGAANDFRASNSQLFEKLDALASELGEVIDRLGGGS
jgi:hypothetical protein